MENLPVEILHEILLNCQKQLKEKSLVSKKFHAVCSKILWKNCGFYSENWGKINTLKKDFLKHIQQLTIKSCLKLGNEPLNGFCKFVSHCKNLTRLNCWSPVINDDDLWIISKYCKHLQDVRLHSIWKEYGKITDQGLQVLSEKKYTIDKTNFSLKSFFIKIDHSCRRRQEVLVSSRGLGYLFQKKLQGFGFQLVNETEKFQELTDLFHTISLLLTKFRDLRVLELDWVLYDMENIIQTASENLDQLNQLKLGCSKKPSALFSLLRRNKQISALEICEMSFSSADSQDFYQALLENGINTRLKELRLDGLGFLTNLLPKKGYFPNLEKLLIVPSKNVASILSSATDDDISQLISSMTRLKSLVIPITTDDPLLVLSSACLELEELDIVDGRNITDSGLSSLSNQCLLKRIALGSASNITDVGILNLIQNHGSTLTRISLPFNNQNISSGLIDNLKEFCPNLEAVTNLPSKISFEELKDFVGNKKSLVILGRCIGESRAFSPLGYLNKLQTESIKKNSKMLAHVIQNG